MDYDDELGRWVAKGRDAWYSLHCGERIRLHIGKRTLHGTIDFSWSWYIKVNSVPLALVEWQTYIVSIEM